MVVDLLGLLRMRGESAISFTDRPLDEGDFLIAEVETGRPLFDDFVDQNREHLQIDPRWMHRVDLSHHHICAIGSRTEMESLERAILDRCSGQVQTFVQKSPRYAGTMCEILHHDATKWSALLHLAASWGVDPQDICAVGDDVNDLPMIRGAGLGVVMGHADAKILEFADHVTGSDDEDGVAMLIENLLT